MAMSLNLSVSILSLACGSCLAAGNGYTLVAQSVTYAACKSRCAAAGLKLPCVPDSTENAALMSSVHAGVQDSVWIGYTDVAHEGNWVWEPGCQSTYTNWHPGQPNNNGDQDCGGLRWEDGLDWHDFPCSQPLSCVCQGCSAGRFRNGNACHPCPMGTSSAPNSKNSSMCTPCPYGYNADSGSPCRPEPNRVVATLAAPNTTATHDGSGHVHFFVEVAALPHADEIYGDATLSYSASLEPDNTIVNASDNVSSLASETCSLQQLSATVLSSSSSSSSSASIDQLRDDCGWNVSEHTDTVNVAGLVSIRVKEAGNQMDHGGFKVPVQLEFPKLTTGTVRGLATTTLVVGGQTFHMANFSSEVAFYDSLAYSTLRSGIGTMGESIFVEQSLRGGQGVFRLSLQRVWLSLSLDPAETTGLLDLTEHVLSQSSPAASGHVRFSFTAGADLSRHCRACAVHVLSSVSLRADAGRRLGAVTVPYHTHAVAPLTLAGPWEAEGGETETILFWVAVACAGTATVFTCLSCLGCLLYRRWKWKAMRQEDPDANANSSGMAGRLSIVTDPRVLHVLEGLLCVAQPGELGKGYDASKYHTQYNDLGLYRAWAISSPSQSLEYTSRQRTVRRDMEALSREGLRPPCWDTKLQEATAELPVPSGGRLNTSVGERWLLHGTKPHALLPILSEGLNPNLSKRGLFGQGTYLAEDMEKVDQYVEADPGSSPERADLHQVLFPGGSHPGKDLFYALVVRSTCGFACRTQDGQTNMDAPGKSLWASTGSKRDVERCEPHTHSMDKELAWVAGSAKHLRYHSLVCELGTAIERFREFVIYQKAQMQVGYLLAYERRT